jgi:hypothetical protein
VGVDLRLRKLPVDPFSRPSLENKISSPAPTSPTLGRPPNAPSHPWPSCAPSSLPPPTAPPLEHASPGARRPCTQTPPYCTSISSPLGFSPFSNHILAKYSQHPTMPCLSPDSPPFGEKGHHSRDLAPVLSTPAPVVASYPYYELSRNHNRHVKRFPIHIALCLPSPSRPFPGNSFSLRILADQPFNIHLPMDSIKPAFGALRYHPLFSAHIPQLFSTESP